jgi:fatty-acyl-CoA synthase
MPVVLTSPVKFIIHPKSWLEMISRYKGTISFAPNFAYEHCVKRIKERSLAEIDLSSWRVAACAAEPIKPATLREFAGKFKPFGFSEKVLFPCYGMAECTVGATFGKPGSGMSTFTADLPSLTTEDRALEVRPGSESVELVSCGEALSGHEVAIADDTGKILSDEGKVGEIVFRGPSVMQGYYNNPDATRELLRDGWLYTGDQGFILNKELYICGRLKEMVIVAGRNYFPQDIEWVAGEIEGIRSGSVISFSLSRPTHLEEKVIVCAETKVTASEKRRILKKELHCRILDALGLNVKEIILLPLKSLNRTSSGKLKRAETKSRYTNGEFANDL